MARFRAMRRHSPLRQAGERLVVGVKTVWRLMNDPRQSEKVLRRLTGVAGSSAPLSFTFTADSVATHVDFWLDNLLIHKGEIAGFIDIGRAGIADRYQDINLQIIRK